MDKQTETNRWRLILGQSSSEYLNFDNSSFLETEQTLEYLYSRERGGDEYDISGKSGSQAPTNLTAVTWIENVRKLFPKEVVEKIERHAVEEFNLVELLCDKQTLINMEPNHRLLKSILNFKHLMSEEVLEVANGLVKKIVDEIKEKLEQDIKRSLLGKVNRNAASNIRVYRNFDVKKTVKNNLKNYDPKRNKLILDRVYFNSNIKRYNNYRIIIVVDESGSMLDSVIHSAIMAAIFAKLPMLDVKLIIFDTEIVDLSGYIDDPVETLMKIRLGGGTNIGKALSYAASLVDMPSKTIAVLVSDLFEGGDPRHMYTAIKELVDSGVRFVSLTALDDNCEPVFDRAAAKNIANLGGYVAALTPEKLCDFIGKVIR